MSNTAITNKNTAKPRGKIPLWVFVVFFTTLLVALSSFGMSQYQQRQAETSQAQQTKVEGLKQSILQQDDVINTNWLHTLNPLVKDVKGSVIWSSHEQQGIIKLSNLPVLNSHQKYHLWIYDLTTKNNAPISALVFKPRTKNITLAFQAESKVEIPFKFELTLEEEGVDGGLSLLLAQP